MNFKKKTVLASGLGALAASVWVPQLLSPGSRSEVVRQESPAEAVGEEPGSPALTSEEELPRRGALEVLGSLEERMAELDSARGATDLGALLARLADGSPGEESAAAEALFAPRPELDPRTELEAFASRNPLTGVIHGSDRSAALLGHRVVRQGDALAGGRITVAGIGPGWIELAADGAHLLVELPAFQARGGGTIPIQARAPAPTTAPEAATPGTQGGA